MEFHLFRLKAFLPAQRHLFDQPQSPQDVIKRAVEGAPEAELRQGTIWHIGNVDAVEDSALYFRFGRTTKSRLPMYERGKFEEQMFETAPYTHVLLDVESEVCAIAKKPRLAPTPLGIANRLVRVLNESDVVKALEARCEAGEVKNPQDFLGQLKAAHSISKFWISFSRPNPFDANRDFVQPMQNLLGESNGAAGKAELKGKDLKSESLEDLSRSAAATGDDAGATMRMSADTPPVKRRLSGNPATINLDEYGDSPEERANLWQALKNLYQRIRGHVE